MNECTEVIQRCLIDEVGLHPTQAASSLESFSIFSTLC